ncbi:MAG: aspartate--tRNA ligase [Candidatus Enterosoma sp.]|nr:aspartate--tRNA ligase [Bacilli bacterium]MDD7607460.1 aspartate--tRNA ligase [bacterium]MDY5866508.1 aspartate--tRNA ligase [Candidatus Enterosoma sp.]
MLRTHNCSSLRKEDVSKTVTLTGWVDTIRNIGSFAFVDLRDRFGKTQIYLDSQQFEKLNLKNEYCIQVVGKVRERKERNPHLLTGDIEVVADKVTVFSKCAVLPFPIQEEINVSEDTRLKYRYLDLRRPNMLNNIILRSKIAQATREFLDEHDFIEVDTPTLIKSTPEGARDYLVPSRIYPGSFYALPQSPQLYKQLLMISGIDRYYQLAHCYRDEDQRADRQPEFMQIDCEMSFVEREDVLNIIEGLLKHIFKKCIDVTLPDFERISYEDAITKYGSDKPDTRYKLLLNDATDILGDCGFNAFKDKYVSLLIIENYADKISRKNMDEDNQLAKKYSVFGFSFIKYLNGEFSSSIVKNIDPESLEALKNRFAIKENDLLIICADSKKEKACVALGALRVAYANKLKYIDKNVYKPLFVIDWPLFEKDDEGHIISLSNPFTRPIDEDLKYLDSDPTKVRSTSYDTVLNGVELSSGALRIHDSDIQKKIFSLLGLSDEDIKERFSFLVEALKYGVPPEGGFGIGVERLAMELAKVDNVRDVIAFPKNLKAFEPLSSCPSKVPVEDTDILGIKIVAGDENE